MYIKTISLILSLIFITTANAYAIDSLNTLRVPVGEHKCIENVMGEKNIEKIKDINDYLKILSSRKGKDDNRLTIRYMHTIDTITIQQLYKRLKDILYRETFNEDAIKEDLEIIELLCFYYKYFKGYFDNEHYGKSYFGSHPDLDPEKVELTRDILVQIIRDLFDPTFERDGFIVIDFFAGTMPQPTLLPRNKLKKIGWNGNDKKLYVYGIDNSVPWRYVSCRNNTGTMRGDVFNLVIAKASVDCITTFHPIQDYGDNIKNPKPIVENTIKSAAQIIRPGAWIYIGLHHNPISITQRDTERYRESLEKYGFIKIKVDPYPYEFPSGTTMDYGRPCRLIKAQKAMEQLDIINRTKNLENQI